MTSGKGRAGILDETDMQVSFLPSGWRDLAGQTGALKGLRKDKSAENLLRMLLLHLGSGHSLAETAERAREEGLAHLSGVALWHRLRKSRRWLQALCVELFRERGVHLGHTAGPQLRALDAITVREPGRTGSLWNLHYSLRLPALDCDFFQVSARSAGAGKAVSLSPFPIEPLDFVLAERGFATASDLRHVERAGGFFAARVDAGSLAMKAADGRPFELLPALGSLRRGETIGSWGVRVVDTEGLVAAGRICALRKTQEAIQAAQERLGQHPAKQGGPPSESHELAKYAIVFTNFPPMEFSEADVLEWYRMRWQVELVLRRFKALAEVGHLPKSDDLSAKAWLYGKLLVALLAEKSINCARMKSPWGYDLATVAGFRYRDTAVGFG